MFHEKTARQRKFFETKKFIEKQKIQELPTRGKFLAGTLTFPLASTFFQLALIYIAESCTELCSRLLFGKNDLTYSFARIDNFSIFPTSSSNYYALISVSSFTILFDNYVALTLTIAVSKLVVRRCSTKKVFLRISQNSQ